jgi:hypothetical protein
MVTESCNVKLLASNHRIAFRRLVHNDSSFFLSFFNNSTLIVPLPTCLTVALIQPQRKHEANWGRSLDGKKDGS